MDCNPLRYLAIGDSLTIGIGVPFLDPGFVEYFRGLSQQMLKRYISYQKYARSGATTKDVLAMLHSPNVMEAVKHADIITITAGGDDLINAAKRFLTNKNDKSVAQAIQQSRDHYVKILERLHRLDKQEHYMIRLTNLYNPFPDIPIAEAGIKEYNSMIQSFSSEKNVKVADIYSIFKRKEKVLLSHGGIHPNSKGYYQMALAISRLGYSPLEIGQRGS
ncbi:spore gernimation protein [Bacillus sp. FJAT-49732]|uniref:Spore gernimation protein n=1 Tax=Lederbergia citrisecunda TaxID=2833583 RepID=A0A942TPP8_9BACI|nr:GDSL-type esterase/lipase family protein [Lederbergia citrisecunda]MBS4201268.1 spore gernimation protein [Lederbergia citrisecunda]